jgi:hypothetical protein
MTDRINPALELLKDIYFAYSESQAATKLNEAMEGKITPDDLEELRICCIEGLSKFVDEMIEKYLDNKITQRLAERIEEQAITSYGKTGNQVNKNE